jgi:hypothetical protein
MKQSKKLSIISRSQDTSKAMGCRSSLIQGLRNIIKPFTKLRKGKMTFRKTQKLVCAPEQPDNTMSEKPGMAYPDLTRPPETETGAIIHTPSITLSMKDRRAQAEAIGSHSRKHPLEENPHKTTTQANYDPQKDNRGAVRCNSTSEKHKEKHPPSLENCATRGTDYRNEEQSGSAIPDIPREGHTGRITIKDNWWLVTQKQSEKQAWQRTICQDRKRHVITTMARIGRTE